MNYPAVFRVKLQLHFGGDVHEICVSSNGNAEPTVADLMNVLERSFYVPRALQNIIFYGQELHSQINEPLSRFGIRNGSPIRLVGRMVPPNTIDEINQQYNIHDSPSIIPQYVEYLSVGTQYDPPSSSDNNNPPNGESI